MLAERSVYTSQLALIELQWWSGNSLCTHDLFGGSGQRGRRGCLPFISKNTRKQSAKYLNDWNKKTCSGERDKQETQEYKWSFNTVNLRSLPCFHAQPQTVSGDMTEHTKNGGGGVHPVKIEVYKHAHTYIYIYVYQLFPPPHRQARSGDGVWIQKKG